MSKTLTVSQKISEKLNKNIKRIYINYRNNIMHMYTNPRTIEVYGNSNTYADSVVMPWFALDKRGVILTRVNETNELVGIYILSQEELKQHSKWITKKYLTSIGIEDPMLVEEKYTYLLQVKYDEIEKFKSPLLLELVNKSREEK